MGNNERNHTMGMFDSMYDAEGHEWQTKAYGCNLDRWHIGDEVPPGPWDFTTYQVGVLGGPFGGQFIDSYATISDGRLTAANGPRDESLPLVTYAGDWTDEDGATR